LNAERTIGRPEFGMSVFAYMSVFRYMSVFAYMSTGRRCGHAARANPRSEPTLPESPDETLYLFCPF